MGRRMDLAINNFTSGEWSHRLGARIDLAKYKSACRTLCNFTVMPHGGATRRPGFRWVTAAKNENADVSLLPFVFSTADAYVIELGQEAGGNTGYARFYRDGGLVYAGSTPYTLATPFTAYHLPDLRYIQSGDMVFMCHPEVPAKVLVRSGHTNWAIKSIDFVDGPYKLYEKGTKVTPSGSTVYGEQCKLVASASLFTSSMLSAHVRWQEGLTWYWFTIDTFHSITKVTATVKGWEDSQENIPLTAYTAGTVRIGAWGDHAGYPRTVGFFEQRLMFGGCGSENTAEPDLQSLWATVTAEYGETCLMSPGTFDDSGLTYTLDSDTQDAIRWIVGDRYLVVGTDGTEWVHAASDLEPMTPGNVRFRPETPRGSANFNALRADNAVLFVGRHQRKLYEFSYVYADDKHRAIDLSVLAEHITEGGMNNIFWVQDPDSVVWSVRNDGVLLGMTYMREEDVVAWHRHTTQGDFKQLCVVPADEHDRLWAVVDRTIGTTTHKYIEYMEKQSGTDVTDAFYVDSGLSYEDAFAVVGGYTTASGSTIYPWVQTAAWSAMTANDTVHLLGFDNVGWLGLNDRSYTLLSVSTAGNTTSMKLDGIDASDFATWSSGGTVFREALVLSGLDHLEGMTVTALVNGATHPDMAVSGGQVALVIPAWRAHVGLGYESELETMRLEYPIQGGSSQAMVKLPSKVMVRFYRTVGAKVGFNGMGLDVVPWRSNDDPMNTALALEDEKDMWLFPPTGDMREVTVRVKQSWPLPSTILGVFTTVSVEG